MAYSISAGVRHNDVALRSPIDRVLLNEQHGIDALLRRYHVPRMPESPATLGAENPLR
jgi:hypothetical protein